MTAALHPIRMHGGGDEPDELLKANGIELESVAPGRYHAECPVCSAKRSKPHQHLKCLSVTIEANGRVHWTCNHCGMTGPQKEPLWRRRRPRTQWVH